MRHYLAYFSALIICFTPLLMRASCTPIWESTKLLHLLKTFDQKPFEKEPVQSIYSAENYRASAERAAIYFNPEDALKLMIYSLHAHDYADALVYRTRLLFGASLDIACIDDEGVSNDLLTQVDTLVQNI